MSNTVHTADFGFTAGLTDREQREYERLGRKWACQTATRKQVLRYLELDQKSHRQAGCASVIAAQSDSPK